MLLLPSSQVWPSGALFATSSAARLPPAPGWFSITTCWPKRSASFWPSARARMSLGPPGVNPTTKRTGFSGKPSPKALPDARRAKRKAQSPIRARLLERLPHVPDQVRAVARLGQAGIGHAVLRHGLLRIGDVGVQGLRAPGDAAALEGGRIAEIVQRAGFAAEHAVQIRADVLLPALQRVAGAAILKKLLAARAVLRIGFCIDEHH